MPKLQQTLYCSYYARILLINPLVFIILFFSVTLAFALPFEKDRPLYSGSRPLSMGNAFISVADDANAGFWNPAGLIQSSGIKVALSTQISERSTNAFDSKSVGYCYREIGLFWGNKIALRVDEDDTPDYNYYSVAYKLNSFLSVGGSAKFKRKHPCKYYQFFGYKVGYDLGILYKPDSYNSFGMLIQDISDTRGLVDIISIGSSNRVLGRTLLSGDINLILNGNVKLETHLGSEIRIYKWLALRLGITDHNPTFGLGINILNFSIDYAIIRDERGNISYISGHLSI